MSHIMSLINRVQQALNMFDELEMEATLAQAGYRPHK